MMTTDQNGKEQREDQAIVLDFLPHGYASESNGLKSPICQAFGTTHLALLELIPKKDVFLQPQEEVYIGDGRRDQIHHIKGKIGLEKLTSTAAHELEHAIEHVVEVQASRFLEFFNKSQPLSMRMHQLELLPGLGKKHMWEILDARKNKPFESYEDLRARVKLMPDPTQILVKRILAEIQGKEKYRLFAKL